MNSSGAIVTSYSYQPFGKTTISGSATTPFDFTGRENDGTGLYYYRARYYDPLYQRFIAQDPIGFAGGDVNLYGYVKNSSPNLADPFGTQVYPGPIAQQIADQLETSAPGPAITPYPPGEPGMYCAQPPPPPPPAPSNCPQAEVPYDWMEEVDAAAVAGAGLGKWLGGEYGAVGGALLGGGFGLWLWDQNSNCS